MTEGISQEALDCVDALDDALGFLTEVERPIVAQAMQSLINSTIERCAAVADAIGESYGMDEAGWTDCTETVATAIRKMKGPTNV